MSGPSEVADLPDADPTDDIRADLLARVMQLSLGDSFTMKTVAAAHKDIKSKFAEYDPLLTAARFAALLTQPQFLSNTLRLEALAHLALTFCRGERKPTDKLIAHAYAALDEGPCGRMEDPAENVFVTPITTSQGNFRIINGIWETPGYWLQRFVNVVEANRS